MGRSLYAMLRRRYGTPISIEERRAFLRASIATGAGLMLGGVGTLAGCAGQAKRSGDAGDGSASGRPGRARGASKRVVIVGGGFAGLAAAHELVKAGHEPIVLEGRKRVGGRVMSFHNFVQGKTVEGGGELIGSNHPMWQAYAKDFGLEMLDLVEDENANAPIVLEGKRLSDDEAAALWEELDAAVSQMNDLAEVVNADEPWETPGAAELDARTLASWVAGLEVSPLCKRAIAAQLSGDNGVANESASLLAMLACVKGGGGQAYWTESEVFRCKGGNDQLSTKLADHIGSHRVRLNSRVVRVEATASGVRVATENAGTIEGDAVIVAIAPSMWPSIEFAGGLPGPLAGLNAPQMGVNVKYLALVKSRFWAARGDGPDALTDGDVTWTWDATNNQNPDVTSDPACLVAFSGGPAAARARARAGVRDGADLREAYAKAISVAHPDFRSAFVSERFMDWPADPWTRGGYSFPAPGQLTRCGPALREGLSNGRVLFAGEHCSAAFPGYMEGALQSGVRAASQIASPAMTASAAG